MSLNLAFGSAMASIGLTIHTLAVASLWLDPPLVLGLDATQMVLLAITVVVGTLSAPLGSASVQQAGLRLTRFAAFVFLAGVPPSSARRRSPGSMACAAIIGAGVCAESRARRRVPRAAG